MTGKPIPPDDPEELDRLEVPAVESLTTRDTARLLRRRIREAAARRTARARFRLRRTADQRARNPEDPSHLT